MSMSLKKCLLFVLICFVIASAIAAQEDEKKETQQENPKPAEVQTQPVEQPAEQPLVKSLKDRYNETIVVTGAMDEEYYWDTTTTMTVIDRDFLNSMLQMSVTNILRYVPGATVLSSGSVGKSSSVRLRGANSNQTLLLLDGIPLNDPAIGIPNFAPLTVSSIGRMEILRGSHSPLYGSSASGGVINIITEKGEGDFHFTFYGEGDNKSIYDAAISGSGKIGDFSYYSNYQTVRSDGKWENDNYKNNTFSIKLGLDISEKTDVTATIHYIDSHIGIPIEVYGSQVFDINSKQDDLTFMGSAILNSYLFDSIDSRLSISLASNRQKFKDPADPGEEFAYPIEYRTDSNIFNLNWANNVDLSENDFLTFGLEIRDLSAESKDILAGLVNYDKNITNLGFFFQNRLNIKDRLFLTASLRYDDFAEYGESFNPRLAAAVLAGENTRFLASYSTGFRIPSLNELYYPYYGNSSLEPEESRTLELGVEQFLAGGNLRLGATTFFSKYENLIGYNYDTFHADNIEKAIINGIEFNFEFRVGSSWIGNAGYTYTYTNKNDEEMELIRMPAHQFYFNLDWKTGDFQFSALNRFVGEQLDNQVVGYPLYNEEYFVTDLHITYDLREGIVLFTKFTNLFDAEYCEVKGYPARQRQWFLGCSFR
jgi:vitamin B12 transporter